MVESRQGSNLLYLPLDKIMQMTAQGNSISPDLTLAAPAAGTPTPSATTPPVDARVRDARTR
jgi:membrane protease subunit HflK